MHLLCRITIVLVLYHLTTARHNLYSTSSAIFTIDTIRKILHWYGSIPNFLHALDKLQSFTLKENRKKKFDFDFPKDLADLKVTKDSVLKDLKKQIRPHCGTLVTLGRLSKSQFTLLSRFIPQLPCYKTVKNTSTP